MGNKLKLSDSINSVAGIGPQTMSRLSLLNIDTVGDLLFHFPSRYLDFTTPTKINQLQDKKIAVTYATITQIKSFYTRSRKLICEALATDETGKIKLIWFQNPYIKKILLENTTYTIAGKPSFWANKLTFISPSLEKGNSLGLNTSGLVPVYPQTEGITSKWLRKNIFQLIDSQAEISDPVTNFILPTEYSLPYTQALKCIHFPHNKDEYTQSDKRLSFNEHLKINLENQKERSRLGKSLVTDISTELHQKTLTKLPFKLTSDQEKTIFSLYQDLKQLEPTHRLIQGDTGSGKTATIIFATAQCLNSLQSCALMAPTEILANQHYNTFNQIHPFPKNIQLVTSGTKDEEVCTNKPMLYIGTHALLSRLPSKFKYPLSFVAIDEQHKFGVKQREALSNRTPVPHLVNLSATPIPRTVALGLLGDINISSIRHQPLNRLQTITHIVSPSHFQKSPAWLNKMLNSNEKIFVVCPNIQDSNTGVSSVSQLLPLYQKQFGQNFPVFAVHGKMNSEQQNRAINDFKQSNTGILIATSLIEVGIDIPEANIMIIHSADRFGLAQLHQLRGRVGRGGGQGYCFLVPTDDDATETERLQLLRRYRSGLILAKKDLKLRGAGEVFGLKQHGINTVRLKHFWSRKSFIIAKKIAIKLLRDNPAEAEKILQNLSQVDT